MVLSQVYEAKFAENIAHMGFLVPAVTQNAGTTFNAVAVASGPEGVQALLDAMMDSGYRQVLVEALNSPSMKDWVRQQLWVFLYGNRKPEPALFAKHSTPAARSHLH